MSNSSKKPSYSYRPRTNPGMKIKSTKLPPVQMMNELSYLPEVPHRKFTGYRQGLLTKCFEMLSDAGGLEGTTKADFINTCMHDVEINTLLENTPIDRLDDMSGIPKLILTIYSKVIEYRYLQ